MIIDSLYLGTSNQKKAQMKKTQDDWKGLKKNYIQKIYKDKLK